MSGLAAASTRAATSPTFFTAISAAMSREIWTIAISPAATAITPRKVSLIGLCQVARLGLLIRLAALRDGRRDDLFTLLDDLAALVDHRVHGRAPLVDGRHRRLLALLHGLAGPRGRRRRAVARVARALTKVAARLTALCRCEQQG